MTQQANGTVTHRVLTDDGQHYRLRLCSYPDLADATPEGDRILIANATERCPTSGRLNIWRWGCSTRYDGRAIHTLLT